MILRVIFYTSFPLHSCRCYLFYQHIWSASEHILKSLTLLYLKHQYLHLLLGVSHSDNYNNFLSVYTFFLFVYPMQDSKVKMHYILFLLRIISALLYLEKIKFFNVYTYRTYRSCAFSRNPIFFFMTASLNCEKAVS